MALKKSFLTKRLSEGTGSLAGEDGTAMLEMAAVTPVLILLFGVIINFIIYLYNAWFIYYNAMNQAVLFAARPSSVSEIESRLVDLLSRGAYNIDPESIQVNSSTDAAQNLITVSINANYNLAFPLPGVDHMTISATGVGYHK